MKLFPAVTVLVSAVTSVLCQTIELAYPTDGTVLHRGQQFTAKVNRPASPIGCYEIGIALTVAHCNNGVCPQPDQGLGEVLYHGPFNPTPHNPGGYYEDFAVKVPDYASTGPGVFTLTHLCLIGAGPFPDLEYRNASVRIV